MLKYFLFIIIISSPAISEESINTDETIITSDTLTLNSEKRDFQYQGNVFVDSKDFDLESETLSGHYNEKSEIEELIAYGSIHITKDKDLVITGNKATYNPKKGFLIVDENPELIENNQILNADIIKYDIKKEQSYAEGEVSIKLVEKK